MTCVRIPDGVVTLADEADPPAGADLRTKAGREAEVIEQVRQFGGFSVFWACDNAKRAHAIKRMATTGRIVATGGSYPWCAYRLTAPPSSNAARP